MDKNVIILVIVYLIGISLLLVFGEIIYRRLKIKGEISRKFAHFVSTLSTLTFPYIFFSHWYVLALAFIFFIVLLITRNGTMLGSIHDIERKSMGSYLLPLSIYLTFLIADISGDRLLYILPMLILAVCDPLAAVTGMSFEKNNHKIKLFGFDTAKSIFGSGAFFISAFIICLIAFYFRNNAIDGPVILLSLIIALTSTTGELFSWRGSDNLTVPLSVILVLGIFNQS